MPLLPAFGRLGLRGGNLSASKRQVKTCHSRNGLVPRIAPFPAPPNILEYRPVFPRGTNQAPAS